MILLIIIGKMIACSGILYGYYVLFLRNKKFHHYNRFYLLASTMLSIVAPFLKIPVFLETDTSNTHLVTKSIDLISVNRWEEELVEQPETLTSSLFTFQNALLACYGIVTIALLYIVVRSLIYISQISRRYPYEYINDLRFYNTTEPGTPFSFFRLIFWNSRLNLESKEGQQIFNHELFHVKQKHSVDILFLEFVSIFFWLNPLFHLIKREIKAIHEFLADQHAIKDSDNFEYAELLILQSVSAKRNAVSNYFFQNHIKRRIAMITQFRNNGYSYWTRLMVLPLSFLLFCALALRAQNADPANMTKQGIQPNMQTVKEPIILLVDAGHGGTDAGARSKNGLLEKDIALSIAQKIKHHAAAYNIKVIMTREKDDLPPLKARTEMAEKSKADMIVSIHLATKSDDNSNGSEDADSGFEVFITNKNEHTMASSRQIGTSILKRLEGIYRTQTSLKQRKGQGIWILDGASCPSVIVHCGYISDEKDVAFVSQVQNQEKIAQSILEAIAGYKNEQKPNAVTFVSTSNTGKQTVPASLTIQNDLVREVPMLIAQTEDTIPGEKDIMLEKQREILLERQIRKQTETQLQHQKLIEARTDELREQQQQRARKENQIQREHQRLTETRTDELREQQRKRTQKENQIQREHERLTEARTDELHKQQQQRTQKENQIQREHQRLTEARTDELHKQQQQRTQKEKEIQLAYRNSRDSRNDQLLQERKLRNQKHEQMLLAKQNSYNNHRYDDTLIEGKSEPVFTKAEIEPAYPGGAAKWENYISSNLRYPDQAKRNKIAGTVIVQFIVDKEGRPVQVRAIDGPEELKEEAERLVHQGGKWIPARQNGRIVKAYVQKHIRFQSQ